MSNIIDLLNKKMPSFLNKTTDEYKAVFGETEFTANTPILTSSDYNCGAVANELELLRAFLNYIISCFNPSNCETEMLEKVVAYFVNLERIFTESDSDLLNRFKAYIQRRANPRWQTTWSMGDLFSYFFPAADVFVIDNYIVTDLLLNGGFEDETASVFDNWNETEVGSSTLTQDNLIYFGDSYSCKFTIVSGANAIIDQTISSVASGDYKLQFWHKGTSSAEDYAMKVTVQRSGDSFYYNFTDKTWQAGLTSWNVAETTNWAVYEATILNTGTYDLTFSFANYDTSSTYNFYLDSVEFGLYSTYPSFKVLIRFDDVASVGSLYLYDSNSLGQDQLIDRGECESTTSPMITTETAPVIVNATWARDSAEYFYGSYSYKFTITAGGSVATVDLVDDNVTTNMHGLTANTQYTFAVRIKIPSGGILGSEVKLVVSEYYSAAWNDTVQAAALTYDAWQYVELTLTLNAATTGVIIRLQADSTAASSEYFNVDDVRFEVGDIGNLAYASFIDNNYISGAGGAYTSDFYQDLLDKARTAGSKGLIEYVTYSES